MTTYTCGPDWQALKTLLSRCQHGDEVQLASGAYEGDSTLCVPSGVTLSGTLGVRISFIGSGPVIAIAGTDVCLQGLTLSITTPELICLTVNDSERVSIVDCRFEGAGTAASAIVVSRSNDVTLLRCDANEFAHSCIKFRSSSGSISDCEAVGSKTANGVSISRDDTTPDQASNVCIAGGRCHDNKSGGISLWASTGLIEDNECWNNQCGIIVWSGDSSYSAPSEVRVRLNRCHNNSAGIVFQSSTGRLEDNTCCNNRSMGIDIRRDPLSPNVPSNVQVIGNRVSDNGQGNILLLSSVGRIENNKCWNSRSGAGISIDRDPYSPEASRDVQVINNQVYDNDGPGIEFVSSTGLVKDNECRNSRNSHCIYIRRDNEGQWASCHVDVIANRCHDNESDGICFSSSAGLVQGNDCWNSRTSCGIKINHGERHSRDHVNLIANRCHDNAETGILFVSSIGRIESNNCWNNRKHGIGTSIHAGTDSDYPDCSVQIIGNRCHDNGDSGISFYRGTGKITHNECFGNLDLSGIVISRGRDVDVIHNRCHDNQQAGIVSIESTTRISQNDCWGSWARSGIVAQQKESGGLGYATVTANRSHDNAQGGIFFNATPGCATGNTCWGNTLGNDVGTDHPDVEVLDHSTSPKEIYTRLQDTSLGRWALNQSFYLRRTAALADFVTSRGCSSCWEKFWSGGLEKTSPQISTAPRQATRAHGTYRVNLSARGTHVKALYWDEADGTVASEDHSARANLSVLLSRYAREWNLFRLGRQDRRGHRFKAPRWTIGLISTGSTVMDCHLASAVADRAADSGPMSEEWNALRPSLRTLHIDMAGHSADGLSLATRIVRQHILTGRSKLARIRQRLQEWGGALLYAPALALLPMMIAATVLAAITTRIAAAMLDVPFPTDVSDTETILGLISSNRSWQLGAGVAFFTWLLLLFGQSLPEGLRPSLPLWLETLAKKIDPLAELVLKWSSDSGPKVKAAIASVLCLSALRRHWLRCNVHGYPVFRWFRYGARDATCVVLHSLDAPTSTQAQEIRDLMRCAPPSQPALVITQMSGLSMLPSAYLDVWFPSQGNHSGLTEDGYIVHDIASAHIHAKDVPTEDSAHAMPRLARILGWDRPDEPLDTNALRRHANMLLDPRWVAEELPLALIVGSTPYLHMSISRYNSESRDHYLDDLRESTRPYADLLDLQVERLQANQVRTLDRFAEQGDGLLLTVTAGEKFLQWLGRVGYRVPLANLLRSLFASEQLGARSDEYLTTLVAAGELYHLGAVRAFLHVADSPSRARFNGSLDNETQLLPLHLEAAHFLLAERLQMSTSLADSQGDVMAHRWDEVITLLANHPFAIPWAHDRVFTLVLSARELLSTAGHAGSDLLNQELRTVIADPFQATLQPRTNWHHFLSMVRRTLVVLTNRETNTAHVLMRAKLNQDWHYLPDSFKQLLQQRIDTLLASHTQQLLSAKTSQGLLNQAALLREQAEYLAYMLAKLAMARIDHTASQNDSTDTQDTLSSIADALLALCRAAGDTGAITRLDRIHPKGDEPGAVAALQLLTDDTLVQRLCNEIAIGVLDRADISAELRNLQEEIEGVALGVRGSLYRTMKMGEDCDQRFLVRAASF